MKAQYFGLPFFMGSTTYLLMNFNQNITSVDLVSAEGCLSALLNHLRLRHLVTFLGCASFSILPICGDFSCLYPGRLKNYFS